MSATSSVRAQDVVQQVAFWGFFLIFLGPFFLLIWTMVSSDYFIEPSTRDKAIVWFAANQDTFMAYAHKFSVAGLGVAAAYLSRSASWRPVLLVILVVFALFVLSAGVGAELGREDVLQRFVIGDYFYLGGLTPDQQKARATLYVGALRGYVDQIQQTSILLASAMTGIQLAKQ